MRSFNIGGAEPPRRWERWVRMYRLPLSMTAGFLFVLMVLAVLSPARPPAQVAGIQVTPRVSRAPVARGCTGDCAQPTPTPVSCVRGSHFDKRAGFCVPNATTAPTRPPTRTLAPVSGTSRPSLRTPGADSPPAPTAIPADPTPSPEPDPS